MVVVSTWNNDLDERQSNIIMDTGVTVVRYQSLAAASGHSFLLLNLKRIWGHCFSSIHRFLTFHSLPCQNPLHFLLFLVWGQALTPTSPSSLSSPLIFFLFFTIIFLVGCPQNLTLVPHRLKNSPFCLIVRNLYNSSHKWFVAYPFSLAWFLCCFFRNNGDVNSLHEQK